MAKAPEGGVSLVVYSDGTMGSEQQVIRRMRLGQLQAGMMTSDGLAKIDPSVKALQEIPMMYRSAAEADYVRTHMIAGIEKRMEDHGFVVVAWSIAGFARLFSKQPALHPQDFLRMKAYVGADDLQEIQILNSIGGHPVASIGPTLSLHCKPAWSKALPPSPCTPSEPSSTPPSLTCSM